MRPANPTAVLLVSAWCAALPAGTAVAENAFDFSKYADSSANLTAVATAVSLVEPCSGKISFSEATIESYDTVELTVACEEAKKVVLRFEILEGGKLRPASFDTPQ